MKKREKEKTTNSRRAGKIIRWVLLGLVITIAGVGLIGMLISHIGNRANLELAGSFTAVERPDPLIPRPDESGNWTFTTDRELKILQLTDVHLGGGWMSIGKDAMAINAVAAMVTAEKPDLIVVTGDISYPVPFQAGTFNNKNGARIFARLMESLGIPWTITYGNHDTEAYSYYDRADLSDFYEDESLTHCLFRRGDDDVDGYGNQIIHVKNSQGLITQSLFLFDSHSYTDHDYFGILWKYDSIHENQIRWYREQVQALSAYNRAILDTLDPATLPADRSCYETVRSLAFFHIPLEEYKNAWNEYADNGYQDTEDVQFRYGTVGEAGGMICSGIHSDNLFETMEELGSTRGIFVGHDHLNNFSLIYKGIRLTYGYSVDYLAYMGIYKLGSQRGCTVIEVSPDTTFNCYGENYYQEKYRILSDQDKENVTMQELGAGEK